MDYSFLILTTVAMDFGEALVMVISGGKGGPRGGGVDIQQQRTDIPGAISRL